MKRIKAQSGFSMIEMMISLLILAIGLLGQMTLQMTSISSNRSSYYRSQASIIANDLADRMRLNEAAINDPNTPITDYENISIGKATTYTAPACQLVGKCKATDLAKLDLYEIQETLAASIPSGTATLDRDATITAQAVYKITISWTTEDRVGLTNGAAVNKFEMSFGI